MMSSGTLARGCNSTRNRTAAPMSSGWRIAARRPAQTDSQRRLAELGRRITRTAQGAGPDSGDRADLDDQSILPLAHRRQDVVNQVERPRQVDGNHLVPVVRSKRLQAAVSHVDAGIADQEDRKSTRLNSSHVAISYA